MAATLFSPSVEWIRRKPVDVRILSGNQHRHVSSPSWPFMLYVTFFDVKRIHNSYEESQRLKEAPTFDDLKFSASTIKEGSPDE
jgi:hypothetical protein